MLTSFTVNPKYVVDRLSHMMHIANHNLVNGVGQKVLLAHCA